MQLRLLGLLLLQPERSWTLAELSRSVSAPQSSVHRELGRAEAAGVIRRDASARPHRFTAAKDDPLYEPLSALLDHSIGIEGQLRVALTRPDVTAAAIFGSWADGTRRPASDIDVLVIGDADLQGLRRRLRPIGKSAGRTIDVTLLGPQEFRQLRGSGASFARRVLDAPTITLVGDLSAAARE
jgi:predicted nucleotidyltransferase